MTAAKHNVIEIIADDQFNTLSSDAIVTVANFHATWADMCKDMNEVFDELSRKFPNLQYLKIEAEEFPEISEKLEISSVPTFIFISSGKELDRVEGANAPKLTSLVEKHSSKAASLASESSSGVAKKDLNTRLKELINSNKVMLFMKGTPQQPRCGFSRTTIELLTQVGCPYGSFNILADEEVRQGLKAYSNWPTFPQIYVDGELIGGLDILKEMIASGDFQAMVPQEEDLESKLKRLINLAPVTVFIKGTPEAPRCGFSRQIIQILNEQNVKFASFDILSDDEVRSGLKTFSNWPTFPQLYVKGELIGGLDIVKELVENNEFQEAVAGAQ
ncbi:thioredoxin-like protein [Polychytrium aggregatum]|uniref:thioredoxin-like protein n=1 Tax=Polychytrium aggregatum TaxID=110093 RepID=UPI0022FE206D|nr:thioredoxin-like protein [Polychytrium aggregatum]KAI9207104.1 thioredoxin-like protein [Polychytrium aggregatum]